MHTQEAQFVLGMFYFVTKQFKKSRTHLDQVGSDEATYLSCQTFIHEENPEEAVSHMLALYQSLSRHSLFREQKF